MSGVYTTSLVSDSSAETVPCGGSIPRASPIDPLEDVKVGETGVLRIRLGERVKIGDFLQEPEIRPIRLNPAGELTMPDMRTRSPRIDIACINDDVSNC